MARSLARPRQSWEFDRAPVGTASGSPSDESGVSWYGVRAGDYASAKAAAAAKEAFEKQHDTIAYVAPK